MKAMLRKKPRNEPIKSPSPDIANRSIIKNTTIEVEDIRMKFKKAQEKQMKFELESSLSHITPSDHASIELKYRQLYDEYNRLRNQIKNIGEQNKVLNQQNGKLVVAVQRNKGVIQNAGAGISSNDQFQREEYYFLKEEKRRLEQELRLQKQKAGHFIKNNETLLLEQDSLRESLKLSHRIIEPVNKINTAADSSEDEKRFAFFANNMLSSHEARFNAILNELNSRINKVELMEKILKEKQERWERENRAGKTPPSYKPGTNWTFSTGVKQDTNKEVPLSQERPNVGFPQISSPFRLTQSVIDIRENENFFNETIRLKDAEISRLRMEKQKLSGLINEYERGPALTPKFREQDDNITKRLSYLQESLRFSKDSCEEYYSLNNRIQQKLSLTENNYANLVQEKKDLISKIEYQQKIIKQYQEQTNGNNCPQCMHLQEEIGKLMTKFKQAEQVYEQNLAQFRNSFQAEVSKYKQEFQRNEYESSCRLKQLNERNQRIGKQNSELREDNQNYIRMLEYIKNVLHIEDIRELLQQNGSIYTEVQTAYQAEMEQYKYQIAVKEDENAELSRKYKLKATEIELLSVEIQRVKRQNSELRSHNIKILSTRSPRLTREKLESNHIIFFQNSDAILDRVRTSEEKVDILYQKINNSVNSRLSSPSRSDF